MLKSLKISGYKVIGNLLELNDLRKVNYLVGKNGAGKSAVLEVIMMAFNSQYYNLDDGVNNIFGYPLSVFKSDFKFEYVDDTDGVVNEGEISLDSNSWRVGKAVLFETKKQSLRSQLGDISHYFDMSDSRKTIPHKTKLILDLDNLPDHISLEKLREFVNENKYFKEPVLQVITAASKDKSIQFLFANGDTYNLRALSEGQIASIAFYFQLLNEIEKISAYKKRFNKSNQYLHIICIEEPETHLHPQLQKLLPGLLNKFSESKSVMFFVATHSPFIISNCDGFLDTQKVYLIDQGQTVNEKGILGERKEGFSEKGANSVAAKMLGADETDFGYVQNYCILEESSLQRLLDILKENGKIKNWGFISAGGYKKVFKLSEKIKQFGNENTLLKCNPFYSDKYCIIIDSPSEQDFDESVEYKKMKGLNIDPDSPRLIVLKQKALENYYDSEIYNLYNEEVKKIDRNLAYDAVDGMGALKIKYAEVVARQILNSPDPSLKFSEVFHGELDFLKSAF